MHQLLISPKALFWGIINVLMFAYWLYLSGTKIADTAKDSLLSAIELVISLLLSVIFWKWKVAWMDILGFVYILATTVMFSLSSEAKEVDQKQTAIVWQIKTYIKRYEKLFVV